MQLLWSYGILNDCMQVSCVLQIPGAGDDTLDRTCRSNSRRCKIDLGINMSHAAYKVSVGSGDTSLTRCHNSHISPKAGSTGRC